LRPPGWVWCLGDETPAATRSHRWPFPAAVTSFPAGDTPHDPPPVIGEYRLYSKKKDVRTGKRKNLGTFGSRAAAEKHERAVQYFKRQ